MLPKGYRKEFVRPPNPFAEHLRCFAHLEGDIGELLPLLNTVLKGHLYFRDPPSLTIKLPGKLVTLTPRTISINIVKDEREADEILEWLMEAAAGTYERKDEIEPSFEVAPRPRVLDILRLLPRTNCRECGLATCMVFAVKVSEGAKGIGDCPCLDEEGKSGLAELLGPYGPG